MAHDTLVYGMLGELELTTGNFLANVIDDCHRMTLYLNLTSPTHYFRAALHCEQPNASLHLLPEAAATQERRLEAVRCKALLGGARECLELLHGGFPTVLACYHSRHAACGLL